MRKENNKSNIQGKREKKVTSSLLKDLDPKKQAHKIQGGGSTGKIGTKSPAYA
jgi:hypothetical protein